MLNYIFVFLNFNDFFWIFKWSNFSFDHFFYYVFLCYKIKIRFILCKFQLHYFNLWFFSIMCLNVISLYCDIRRIKREYANNIYVTFLHDFFSNFHVFIKIKIWIFIFLNKIKMQFFISIVFLQFFYFEFFKN